jgi:hypothetical protein
MTSVEKTADKKARFPEVLKDCLGIISTACQKLRMSRQLYYNWYNSDPEFKAACEEASEEVLDLGESVLHQLVKEKNVVATIFLLKTLGKKRGYVERLETTGKDGGAIKNEIELSGAALETFERARARARERDIAEFKASAGL